MERVIGFKLGKLEEGDQSDRKKKSANEGNRQEQKLKKEIKDLRQILAKISNKPHRRRQRRKVTKKEKDIIQELKVLIEKGTTNCNLRNARRQWLDKLRCEKIKLEKYEEKHRTKQDNIIFQRDQKEFFKTLEREKAHEREMMEMEKFVEFWEDIWEKEERTPTCHGWKR